MLEMYGDSLKVKTHVKKFMQFLLFCFDITDFDF